MARSAWRIMDHLASAEEAEALACLEGVRLATNWLSQPAVVESDCLGLLRAVTSKEHI
jgi:hypothetical protein